MLRPSLILLISGLLTLFGAAAAQSAESAYSKLDFDRDCIFEKPASEEEAGMGATGQCNMGNFPTVYFMEGDLRQSAGFGAPKQFQSFGQFNRMNTTIEWRSNARRPYAAIVRFFIENVDPNTDRFDKSREGQVLVVHRVAAYPEDQTCIVGLVDARANGNANILARRVADELAQSFDCDNDRPQYLGRRGQYSGDLAF